MNIALLLGVILIAFLVNVPLGRMRSRAAKFSWQWFVYVHASIPLIVGLRIGLGFGPSVIPLTLGAAVVGQLAGGRLAV